MPEELTYDYSPAHFAALSEEERMALLTIADHTTCEPLDGTDEEQIKATFNCLRPCEGCVPEDEIGEDLVDDIRRKFSAVYYAGIVLAEASLERQGLRAFTNFAFCLVIDASYEHPTHVAVVDYQSEERPFCYFHTYCKAWHFSFESLRAIAREVLQTRNAILAVYWRLAGPREGRNTPPAGA